MTNYISLDGTRQEFQAFYQHCGIARACIRNFLIMICVIFLKKLHRHYTQGSFEVQAVLFKYLKDADGVELRCKTPTIWISTAYNGRSESIGLLFSSKKAFLNHHWL